MIKRLIIIILTLIALAATWITCFSVLIILIFNKRHPDHCMAEYYNFFLPDSAQYSCGEK